MAKKLRKSAKVTAADRIRFHLPTPPEGFQGNEEISELFAPTLAALDKRIEKETELHSSDEMTTDVLMRGPHPDGGFVAVLYSHNFNPFTWIKEKYHNRGGGPEERDYLKKLQRKQELDRRRAIKIARGNARNRVAAIKVTEQEYRRAGINPGKKVKVRTEHEFYGEKTFKALKPQTEYEVGPHGPYNEGSRKNKSEPLDNTMVQLSEVGQNISSQDPLILAIKNNQPVSINKLAGILRQPVKNIKGQIGSLAEAKLVIVEGA
jgi:hypothetical protein